jgi:hypothetical protein
LSPILASSRPSLRDGARLPILSPEKDAADLHSRRRRCLFSRRASASSFYHPQATKNSRSLRSKAPGQALLMRLGMHQGRSSAHAGARECGARYDCGNPDVRNSFALASTPAFTCDLRGLHP